MEFYFSAISLRISSSFVWYPHWVISGHLKISNFQNFWKKISKIKKKNFGLSFFSFQFNAKNRFVISHTVRLWWKVKSVASKKKLPKGFFFVTYVDISNIRIPRPLVRGRPAFNQWEHRIYRSSPIIASKISSNTNAKVEA